MARSNNVTDEQAALVLVIDRVFDAPRELVWRLWRDPEHMVRWHGPEGMWLTACESEFRVGGTWRRSMAKDGGYAHWIHGTYLEIVEPSRLRFTYVNDYDGFESKVSLDFTETEDGRTRMQFRQSPFISKAECEGHGWGWNSGFNLLAEYLSRFIDADLRPKGAPRIDGVAEDLIAARRRQSLEQQRNREGTHHADTATDH